MKIRTKGLIPIFLLLHIITATPLYYADSLSEDNGLFNHNYGEFDNDKQYVNNIPSGYRHMMSVRSALHENSISPYNIYANFKDHRNEYYGSIPTHHIGLGANDKEIEKAKLNNNENQQPSDDDTSEILETSGNTFYGFNDDYYNPFYHVQPISVFPQSQFRYYGSRRSQNNFQRNPFLAPLLSIEKVPFTTPIVWTPYSNPYYQQPQPVLNFGKLPFPLPNINDHFLPDYTQQPSHSFINNLNSDPRNIISPFMPNGMSDEIEDAPNIIQIGFNNTNEQTEIIQVDKGLKPEGKPPITTTEKECSQDETSTPLIDTTTSIIDLEDEMDEKIMESP